MTNLKRHIIVAATATVAAILFAAAPVNAQESGAQLLLGNCRETGSVWVSASGTDAPGAAIFYPAEVMGAYRGCRISALRISLDAASEGSVTFFISRSAGSTPLYTETVANSKYGWSTFTLAEPYEIDGGDLCIGYTVTGRKSLMYTSPFVVADEWICDGPQGWRRNDTGYSAGLLAVITGDNLPKDNIHIGTSHLPQYLRSGKSGDCWATFQNLGLSTVTSLDVAVLVDGTEQGVETVDGLNVGPRCQGEFSISGYKLDRTGQADMSVVVKAVNGRADAVPSDNATPTARVTSLDDFTPRRTLLEFFSTERCTGCPSAHKAINPIVDSNDSIIELGHHAGFYTDKFTISESTDYEWFYKPGNVHAPAIMIDRTNFGTSFPSVFNDSVPIINASAANVAGFFGESQQIPAFVEIGVKPRLDGRSLMLDVDYRETLPIADPSRARLFVFLTEDSVYSETQAAATQGFYHRHVARRSLTSTWGDSVTLPESSANFSLDIPADWDVARMRAVAFVANYNADDRNDCRVYNAAEAPLLQPTAINALTADDNAPWHVFTASGVSVASGRGTESMRAALRSASGGVYVVKAGGMTMKIAK